MQQSEELSALNKISTNVGAKDKLIWENEAFHTCITKETEKIAQETEQLRRAIKEMEREDGIMEAQLEEITQSIPIQQQTLSITEKSVQMHKSLKENLFQEIINMKEKYSQTTSEYSRELQQYRLKYEETSEPYKELHVKQIELKKLKFKKMDLEAKIRICENIQEQFDKIQTQIFESAIVNFAEMYVCYLKREQSYNRLTEKKIEEKKLLKEHLQLEETVKQRQVNERRKNIDLPDIQFDKILREKIDTKPTVEETLHETSNLGENLMVKKTENNDDLLAEKLQSFMTEDFKLFETPSENSKISPLYNEDNSKVRILDVKIMNPMPKSTKSIMRKTKDELRKEMEAIVHSKRNILRCNSLQSTPASQIEKLSQGSQENECTKVDVPSGMSQTLSHLSLDEKISRSGESVVTSSILKCKETIMEKCVEDKTSKFFNTNKKIVTFQNEGKTEKSVIQETIAQPVEVKKFIGEEAPKPLLKIEETVSSGSQSRKKFEDFLQPSSSLNFFGSANEKQRRDNVINEPMTSNGSLFKSGMTPSFNMYSNQTLQGSVSDDVSNDPFEDHFGNVNLMTSPPDDLQSKFLEAPPHPQLGMFCFGAAPKNNDIFNMF